MRTPTMKDKNIIPLPPKLNHNMHCAIDENGLFDGRGWDLALIGMIDRRVGLDLSPRPSQMGRGLVG